MPAFANVYGVELFYRTAPELTTGRLLEVLRTGSADIALARQEREGSPWVFEHREHLVPPRRTPARCLIAISRQPPNPELLQSALKQSWDWPESAEVLPQCGGSLLVTDVGAAALHHLERLILFERVLVSLLQAYPCLAIHWQPTQQIVQPDRFLASVAEAGGLVFMPGPLNVRLFRIISDEPSPAAAGGDILMDTLGLAAVGLPDLQCHFTGLEPEAVSRVLYNTGIYLFERGDVLDDGHTVPGISADQKWRCRRERSLALPERIVVDLDPGYPYSARDRR